VERQALYYPYIRVPEDAWFTRVLLYWDGVGTILPQSLAGSASVVGSYTSTLIDAGLVQPVWPAEDILRIDGFAERFFAIIDADDEIRRMGERPVEHGAAGQIHEEKFTDEIFRGLHERGLGERSEDSSWWKIESRTAGIYMAYLAASLGALEHLRMDPVSDSTALFVPAPESAVAHAEALRLGLLEAVLPGPAQPVSVEEVVSFKEAHADELTAFRTVIESELMRIAVIDDEEARTREKSLTEDRLRQQVDEIAAEMHRRRWPKVVFGTIAGLASIAATATAAVGTGGVALAFAAPGVISGAYAAVEGFPRRQTSTSPLAFAALAEEFR